MARHNKTGRSKGGGQFVQLPHFMLESPAWRALSAQDRATYLAVAMVYNGFNNGRLAVGARQIAERANINKDTASKCVARLQERGFIECASPGGFSRKNPHATEWRLTLYKCDRTNALATKAFMKWRPETEERGPLVSDSRSPRFGQSPPKKAATVPSFRTVETV